jgi:shikimate dehydrogenase
VISAGVLGSPISHSLSPLLHNTVYEFLGIKASYMAYEVSSGQLRNFLDNDGSALNNLSLTMPLKEEALAIADSISDISLQIQSGNTLRRDGGLWNLTSTDVDGFTHALQFNNRDAKGNVLIIGAGATARAVVAACDRVSESVTVINRNPGREHAIRNSGPNQEIDFISWNSSIDFNIFDLVVNTTPGETASILVDQIGSPSSTFFEVLYNPWPTQLLSHWRKAGGFGIDGLDLLIHQAISQVEIFASCVVERESIAKMLRTVGEKALS